MLHLLAGLAKLAASRKSDVTTKPESKKKYRSGSKAPASGIYGCVDCSTKRTVSRGHRLPPCHSEWVVVERTT